MARQIGDNYFNHLFPDQSTPASGINRPRQSEPTDSPYQYKTVRVPGAKASPRRHAAALERLAGDGWELVDVRPRGFLQWGTKDTVTVRRKR